MPSNTIGDSFTGLGDYSVDGAAGRLLQNGQLKAYMQNTRSLTKLGIFTSDLYGILSNNIPLFILFNYK